MLTSVITTSSYHQCLIRRSKHLIISAYLGDQNLIVSSVAYLGDQNIISSDAYLGDQNIIVASDAYFGDHNIVISSVLN